MRPRHCATLMAMVVLSVGLAGCGSGGGGSTPPPVGGQQRFLVDFLADTVRVVHTPAVAPQFAEPSPGDPGAELKLALAVVQTEPGNPGRHYLDATVTNQGVAAVGTNAAGALTGLDICLVAQQFQTAAGAPVAGGRLAGSDFANPLTGFPVYHLAQSLAPGATSAETQMDVLLPPTATRALLTLTVRADTLRVAPPAPDRLWASTVAGRVLASGYLDAPGGQALFAAPLGACFREDTGELLLADSLNNAIRVVKAGHVTSLVSPSAAISAPRDVAVTRDGWTVFSEAGDHCLSAVCAGISGRFTIAGTRGVSGDVVGKAPASRFYAPAGLCSVGNVIYVCDRGNSKLKAITYLGGYRYLNTSYSVAEVPLVAAMLAPSDVVMDKQGNLFVASGSQVWVKPADSSAWTFIAAAAPGYNVSQLALDDGGDLYLAQGAITRLRRVGAVADPAGWVLETLLPAGAAIDGAPGAARATNTVAVAVTRGGTIYFVDGNAVRCLDRTR